MPYSAGMEKELQSILNRLEQHPAPIEIAEKAVNTWRTGLVIRAYSLRDTTGETLPAIAARLGISYVRAWAIVRAYKAWNLAAAGNSTAAGTRKAMKYAGKFAEKASKKAVKQKGK